MVVNKTLEITPWESKCLVRAMTAKKMMKKRGYKTTLYLGVGKDEKVLITFDRPILFILISAIKLEFISLYILKSIKFISVYVA